MRLAPELDSITLVSPELVSSLEKKMLEPSSVVATTDGTGATGEADSEGYDHPQSGLNDVVKGWVCDDDVQSVSCSPGGGVEEQHAGGGLNRTGSEAVRVANDVARSKDSIADGGEGPIQRQRGALPKVGRSSIIDSCILREFNAGTTWGSRHLDPRFSPRFQAHPVCVLWSKKR